MVATLQKISVILSILITVVCAQITYYNYSISQNGTDTLNCSTGNSSCGTLYYVSTLIDDIIRNPTTEDSYIQIYIIDGQNEDEIKSYLNNTRSFPIYHPCLLMPLLLNNHYFVYIHIWFNNADWYPSICQSLNRTQIINSHMFYIKGVRSTGATTALHDLRIKNMAFGSGAALMAILWTNVDFFSTNNLNISNIFCFTDSDSWDYEILSFWYSFTSHREIMIRASFTNISVINSVIPFMQSSQSLYITNCTWQNLNTSLQFPNLAFCIGDYIYVNYLTLNISYIQGSYLFQVWKYISIKDSRLINIRKGGICRCYYGECTKGEVIRNEITLNQAQGSQGFSIFEGGMIFADNVIIYYYDLYKHCFTNGIYQDQYAYVIRVYCLNPYMLLFIEDYGLESSPTVQNVELSIIYINNNGDIISLDDYRVHVAQNYNFTQASIANQSLIIPFEFQEDTDPLIMINVHNSDTIHFQNISFNKYLFGGTIIGLFSYSSDMNLSINEFQLKNGNESDFNPNDLIATNFAVFKYHHDVIFEITNANIYGVKRSIINATWPISLTLRNVSFHHAYSAIISQISVLLVESSSFYSLGNYFTDITYYGESGNSTLPPIYLEISNASKNVNHIENSVFSYYSTSGILGLLNPCSFIFHHNLFNPNMDQSHWYRNIPANLGFASNVEGLVSLDYNSMHACGSKDIFANIQLVNNTFGQNNIDPMIPSVRLQGTKDSEFNSSACLTGSMFYNYALLAINATVSSCARPQLANNVMANKVNKLLQCGDIEYGPFNFDLLTLQNIFLIDNGTMSIIRIDNGLFAMDNMILDIMVPMTEPIIHFKNSTVMLVDTVINNVINMNTLFGYDHDANVVNYCRQYYQTSDQITQFWISYDNRNIDINSSAIEYVNHLSPISIELKGVMNNTYFPGGQFIMDYKVFDKYHNSVPSSAFAGVVLDIQSADLFVSESVTISHIGCPACDKGIYFANVIMEDVGETYNFIVSEGQNGGFFTSNITIEIVGCQRGYGISTSGQQCELCADGYFSITGGDCYSCDELKTNKAITCSNGDQIIIKQHYWMGFKDDDMSQIISAHPPAGQGCTLIQGCNYLLNKPSLCAENRNSSSIMCSECIHGYSELFLSHACGKCDKNMNHVWLFAPFGMAVFVVISVLICKSSKPHSYSEPSNSNEKKPRCLCNCCRKCYENMMYALKKQEYLYNMIKIMVKKCILYYQQSISQIFLESDISLNLASFSAMFNLSFYDSASSTKAGIGLCFFDGMTAKDEILANLIAIGMIFLLLIIIYTMYRLMCPKWTFLEMKPHFGKTFVAILLLCIGKISSVLFKLLACQNVGDQMVHFYFGYDECFDGLWWIALIGLIITCMVFIIFSISLYRMDDLQRQHEENILRPLTLAYKPQFYYWEFVILIRRLLIAFLTVGFGADNAYTKCVLIGVLFICVRLQTTYQPFKIHEANNMELNLLICIIMIVVIDMVSDELDEMLIYIILTMLIVFPFISLFWWIMKYQRKKKELTNKYVVAWDSNNNQNFERKFYKSSSVNAPLSSILLKPNSQKQYNSFSSDQ